MYDYCCISWQQPRKPRRTAEIRGWTDRARLFAFRTGSRRVTAQREQTFWPARSARFFVEPVEVALRDRVSSPNDIGHDIG